MNTILVSYDLMAPGKDYARLWSHLESYPNYIKPLESVWLIKTTLSAEEIRNKIKLYIDSNDRLLVINVTGDGAAWQNLIGGKTHTEWIKENL